MKKVLVTGGAGFIGFHLIKYLSQKKGYAVHMVDNLSRGKWDIQLKRIINHYNIKFIKADLINSQAFLSLDNDYDYIYHLSAIIGVRNVVNNPDKVLYVNIVSALNLLKWINGTQKNLKGLLFASTSEVYAGTLKHYGVAIPTDERVNLCLDDITSPRTTYALSKIVGEAACFNFTRAYRIPITIVRYHNVFGPRMGYDHVIPELMLKAKNSKKYLEVFSVKHTRSFCYIRDAIEASVKLIENRNSSGQLFNIGNSEEEVSIRQLAQKIIKVVRPSLKIKTIGDQPGSPLRRCPDIRKLKQAIKFRPKVGLDEGIRLTWDWYKNNV